MPQEKARHTLVSLKWPAHIDAVGSFKVFEGQTVSTSALTTKYSVSRVFQQNKWRNVGGPVVSVNDDCVVSRQYFDELPKQEKLKL